MPSETAQERQLRRVTLRELFAWLLPALLFCGGCERHLPSNVALPPAQTRDPGEMRFRLLFGGDFDFGESYQKAIVAQGGENVLETRGYEACLEKLAPLLNDSNLAIVNLETVITSVTESPFAGRKEYIHWTDLVQAPATLNRHHIRVTSGIRSGNSLRQG